MKQRLFIVFIALVVSLRGQSFFSPLIGDLPAVTSTRQIGVGFSSWGNSGSAAALFTNPALIALSDRKVAFYFGMNGNSINEKRSFPVQDSFGDFLADNTYVVNANWYPGIQVGMNYRLLKSLYLGLAFQQFANRNFRYEEEVRGSVYGQYNRDPLVGYHRLSSTGNDARLTIGSAYRLFNPLRIAAAFQIQLPGEYEDRYEVEVIRSSVNLAAEETVSYRSKPTIAALKNVILGISYDVNRHLSLAAAYKFRYDATVEDGLFYLVHDTTSLLPVFAIDSTRQIRSADYNRPSELRLSLKYEPQNIIKTAFYLEAVYQPWSQAKVDYEFRNEGLPSSFPVYLYATSYPLRDVLKIHVAVEHLFFSGVPFRMGFYHDPNPIDAGMDRNWFTAGTGYIWGNLALDVSGAFAKSEYDYPDLFPIVGEERLEFDSVRETYLIGMLTLKYTF